MKTINEHISINQLRKIAEKGFGDLVKAVVDVKKEIMVIDAELHSDEEARLINNGSAQDSLWGINLYPAVKGDDWIEFDSMINLRPMQNNISRGVDDPNIRNRIIEIVNKLVDK